jgi:hypothetical protein
MTFLTWLDAERWFTTENVRTFLPSPFRSEIMPQEIETEVAMFLQRFGESRGQMHSVAPGSKGDCAEKLQLSYAAPGEQSNDLHLTAVLIDGKPMIRATFTRGA